MPSGEYKTQDKTMIRAVELHPNSTTLVEMSLAEHQPGLVWLLPAKVRSIGRVTGDRKVFLVPVTNLDEEAINWNDGFFLGRAEKMDGTVVTNENKMLTTVSKAHDFNFRKAKVGDVIINERKQLEEL